MAKQKDEKLPLFYGNSNFTKNKEFCKQYLQENEDAKDNDKKCVLRNNKRGIALSWHNITANLKPKCKFGTKSLLNRKPTCILKDVSGIVEAGGFLAIMGLSGSGKTTLLNVLTNRNVRSLDIMGEVKLNGHNVGDAVMNYCSYVQQDDLLRDFLTVREHLIFQAMLMMDEKLSNEEKMLRVQDAIDELNLSNCANTKIGVPGSVVGVSGGERRRLSLAIELLTNPTIIFCDEPTSGLDSYSAINVVTALQKLNENGRTVIFTVHQPPSEVYELFDKILLMALGRVAYMGEKAGAVSFFENMNLRPPENFSHADFFMYNLAIMPQRESQCIEKVNMICDIFSEEKREKDSCKIADLPEVFRYKSTWIMQMKMLLWRSFTQLRREYNVALTGLAIAVLITISIMMLFYGQKLDQKGISNMNGGLCLLLAQLTQRPYFVALHRFSRELPYFFRENRNGVYRADTHFLCVIISDLPIVIFTGILCTAISYHAIGLNSETPAFWICLLAILLSAEVSVSFGYMISNVCSSFSSVTFVGSSVLILLFVFSGLFLNETTIPGFISWIKYFSHFYHGYKIVMINQWRNIGNITCESDAPGCIHDGKGVLEAMNLEESEFYSTFISIVGLIIFYQTMAFSAFYIRSRRKS